jgi:hypothetical protein
MKRWVMRASAIAVIAAACVLIKAHLAEANCASGSGWPQYNGVTLPCYLPGQAAYNFVKFVDRDSRVVPTGASHAEARNATSVSSSAYGRVQCSVLGNTTDQWTGFSGYASGNMVLTRCTSLRPNVSSMRCGNETACQ